MAAEIREPATMLDAESAGTIEVCAWRRAPRSEWMNEF
jgi:hypothetical protein